MEKLESTLEIDHGDLENPIIKQMFKKYQEYSQQATLINRGDICGHSKGSHTNHTKGSSGGCYLTTACLDAMGLPDNCPELTILRSFRDKVLMSNPLGRKFVREYYKVAPQIVKSVNEQANPQEIWKSTYRDIRKAVGLILRGDFEGAFNHYKKMSLELQGKYLD